MKITDKRNEGVKFACLDVGQVFMYQLSYYMKTDDEYINTNAVHLQSGKQSYFDDDVEVKIVDAELIIKGVHD